MTTGPARSSTSATGGTRARTGRWPRRRAIWRDGVRISLGLGRGVGAKFASWLLIGLALVPIVVLVVIAGVRRPRSGATPSDFDLPSYADYYGFAVVPLGLFAAVVAPLLICPDRRDGVLSLYAARPITDRLRRRPLGGVPHRRSRSRPGCRRRSSSPGTRSTRPSPGSWLVDNWDVVPRFLAAGAVVAVVLTTLALFAASFATRRAYAAVAILAVLFVGSAIGGIAEDNFSGRVADALSLASLPQALVDSVHWIFGDTSSKRPLPGSGRCRLAGRPDGGARRRARAPDRAAGARVSRVEQQPTIVVDGLSKWFAGVVAVSDVSLASSRASPRCWARTAPARRRCCARSPG